MEAIDLEFEFNNKGLKNFFPGSVVTKKKMQLAQLDAKFLASAIKSSDTLKRDFTNFEVLEDDLTLEGEYNKWVLGVKIKVY